MIVLTFAPTLTRTYAATIRADWRRLCRKLCCIRNDDMLTLGHILTGSAGELLGSAVPLHTPIDTVVIDSRAATPDSLFVALVGENTDGHNYIADAIGRGAVAVLARRAWFDAHPLPDGAAVIVVDDPLVGLQQAAVHWLRLHPNVEIVGITGSVGKSTTKELVGAVLAQRYPTLKPEKSYNNEIGLPLTVLRLQDGDEKAVLEIGGGYELGEITRMCALFPPKISIVTMVAGVHLERMGTIENIALNKSEIVSALPPDGVAVLNGDDVRVRAMQAVAPGKVIFYGLDTTQPLDIWATDIAGRGLDGIGFTLHYRPEAFNAVEQPSVAEQQVRLPLLGRHSVYNALAAMAVGLLNGMELLDIIGGLNKSAKTRLLVVLGANGSTVIDDSYNASPASVIAALDLLADVTPANRKIAVLGDMLELGTDEREGHQRVGRRAAETVDRLIVYGERARIIGEAAIESGLSVDKVTFAPTKRRSSRTCARRLRRAITCW